MLLRSYFCGFKAIKFKRTSFIGFVIYIAERSVRISLISQVIVISNLARLYELVWRGEMRALKVNFDSDTLQTILSGHSAAAPEKGFMPGRFLSALKLHYLPLSSSFSLSTLFGVPT